MHGEISQQFVKSYSPSLSLSLMLLRERERKNCELARLSKSSFSRYFPSHCGAQFLHAQFSSCCDANRSLNRYHASRGLPRIFSSASVRSLFSSPFLSLSLLFLFSRVILSAAPMKIYFLFFSLSSSLLPVLSSFLYFFLFPRRLQDAGY